MFSNKQRPSSITQPKNIHNNSFASDAYHSISRQKDLHQSRSVTQFLSRRKSSNGSSFQSNAYQRLETELRNLRAKSQSRGIRKNNTAISGDNSKLNISLDQRRFGSNYSEGKPRFLPTSSTHGKKYSKEAKRAITATSHNPSRGKLGGKAQNLSLLFPQKTLNNTKSTMGGSTIVPITQPQSKPPKNFLDTDLAAGLSVGTFKERSRLTEIISRQLDESQNNQTEKPTADTAHDGILRNLERSKIVQEKMAKELEDLDKTRGLADEHEFAKSREQLLAKHFTEIVNLDPIFGDILQEIKEVFDAKRSEVLTLAKEKQKQAGVIESQKMVINGLKTQAASYTKECRQELAKAQEKVKKLEKEVETVNFENTKLVQIVKKLYVCMKDQGSPSTKVKKGPIKSTVITLPAYKEKPKAKLNKSVMEIGKRKVKVPVLNLQKLAPSKPTKLTVVKYKSSRSNSSFTGHSLDDLAALEDDKVEPLVLGSEAEGIYGSPGEDPENLQEMLNNLIESANDGNLVH